MSRTGRGTMRGGLVVRPKDPLAEVVPNQTNKCTVLADHERCIYQNMLHIIIISVISDSGGIVIIGHCLMYTEVEMYICMYIYIYL